MNGLLSRLGGEQRKAQHAYDRDAKRPAADTTSRLSVDGWRVMEAAQVQAREFDDNHVGTEHITLGIFAVEGLAVEVLETLGISREIVTAQLEEEDGESPSGEIPLTPRARMILAMAVAKARQVSASFVGPEHILLGVIAESQKWALTGRPGPHHLRAAAEAAGTTLAALQGELFRKVGWST